MRKNIVKKSIMNNNPIRPRVIKKVRLKLLASLICKSLNLNQTIKNNLGKPPTKTSQSLINCNILSKLCIFANILSLKQTRVLRWILQECGDFSLRVSDCEEIVGQLPSLILQFSTTIIAAKLVDSSFSTFSCIDSPIPKQDNNFTKLLNCYSIRSL